MRTGRRHLHGPRPLSGLLLLLWLVIPVISYGNAPEGEPRAWAGQPRYDPPSVSTVPSPASAPAPAPARIISLSPATTEILFALGLGPKIAGVTRYCDFPAETASIPRIGGLVDPNYEAIAALKPDLAIVLTTHRDLTAGLEKLGIPILVTPHRTVADVHEAIRLIGDACGAGEQAAQLNAVLNRRAAAVQQAVQNRPVPSVLLCIARDFAGGQLSGMYMAGDDGFYDAVIGMAGGRNACTGETLAFPQLSAESVIELNPEVIVDLTGVFEATAATDDRIARHWDRLNSVAAVRNRRVYTIGGTHALRPGPRYVTFLEELAALLHPDAFPWPPETPPASDPACTGTTGASSAGASESAGMSAGETAHD